MKTSPLKIAICISNQFEFSRQRTIGAGQYAIDRGWDVEVINSASKASLPSLKKMKPDGIITFGCDLAFGKWVMKQKIPIIETARPTTSEFAFPCVVPDEAQIGRLAFEHLASKPKTALAYIGNSKNPHSKARQHGFETQLLASERELFTMDTDRSTSTDNLVAWLQTIPSPTAIFTFDCGIGRKLIEACRIARKSVPDSISVLTVGPDEILCSLIQPPLSSVQIPGYKIGQQAAEILEKLFHGETAPPITLIEASEIIVRRSTRADQCDDAVVRKALEFITSKCHDVLSVPDVAIAVGMNRRSLERRFNCALGRSIHSEISERRIEKAKELLRSSSLSIEMIAEDLQYSSAATFSRSFKSATGIPPKLYRENTH